MPRLRSSFRMRLSASFVLFLCLSCGPSRTLRVCADPNNLPFSNQQQQGFENRVASLLADRLNANLTYTWWAQRRGFLRNTLNARQCDLVIGVPSETEGVRTTRPYYRSSYVFVTRGWNIRSLGAPELHKARIGVQLVGDDYANTPPVHALARHGLITNVTGYRVAGNYTEANPPARIMDALNAHDIDVAIVWGPLAGYFARRHNLLLTPVPQDGPLPFAFDISMAVRKDDPELYDEIEAILSSENERIQAILDDYGVPRT